MSAYVSDLEKVGIVGWGECFQNAVICIKIETGWYLYSFNFKILIAFFM
jgi:hypothetical protein